MFDGFTRVMAASPAVRPGGVAENAAAVKKLIALADSGGVSLLTLPELCLTGYTCGDLFLSDKLLNAARDALLEIADFTRGSDVLTLMGLPLQHLGKLYSCAAAVCGGRIAAIIPKTCIPSYAEFYEGRHFTPAPPKNTVITLKNHEIPFGRYIILENENDTRLRVGVEICEDLWVPEPPSGGLARAGATVIANLSASDETVGKPDYRRLLVSSQSARLIAGYVYAAAGSGESGADMSFGAHNIICENGVKIAESEPFGEGIAAVEFDLNALAHDRRRQTTFLPAEGYETVKFSQNRAVTKLTRPIDPRPFVPRDEGERHARAFEILNIQAEGLITRLSKLPSRKALIGLSGGLDSALALIAAHRAFVRAGWKLSDLIAVTMPCFGTTARTRRNAELLAKGLGVSFEDVRIKDTVQSQFNDIGLDPEERGVTYENVQARVRTLTLMDMANKIGAIVIGTCDLSELALGWATYNGDHMSMYGLNSGVPKTLVRYIIKSAADDCGGEVKKVLYDILDTPISPELLPPKDGKIAQKTEEILGAYELHDFFLYHTVRRGREPLAVYELANTAFKDAYPPEEILSRLNEFNARFFSQQFKRNCMPDGVKVGSVTLSPRSDWRMPSDADGTIWQLPVDS